MRKLFTSFCMLFLVITICGQNTTIELTFTATNNLTHIPLDSIRVVNLTQGGETVLYGQFNDTVLVLTDPIGINEFNRTGEQLRIFQNYPNPVKDHTTIKIFIPKKDKVCITITDMLGRKIMNDEMILERGYHTYSYQPGKSEISFFSVFWRGSCCSIKILSAKAGSAHSANLEYNGNTLVEPKVKQQKSMQSLPWSSGDLLEYTGYSTLDNTIIASDIQNDIPLVNTTYTFDILKGLRCSVDDSTVMDIDGNVYHTLRIGDQCWMAENLQTTKLKDGTAIPNTTDNTEWEKTTSPAYCWYSNNIAHKDPYGALYNWYTVETGKLCPEGWHVPSDAEWTSLTDFLGGVDVAGKFLKEKGIMHWNTDVGATNETGFTAVGGGSRGSLMALFLYMREYGYWWSSTLEISTMYAWYRHLRHNTNSVSLYPTDRNNGFSVRCLKDE